MAATVPTTSREALCTLTIAPMRMASSVSSSASSLTVICEPATAITRPTLSMRAVLFDERRSATARLRRPFLSMEPSRHRSSTVENFHIALTGGTTPPGKATPVDRHGFDHRKDLTLGNQPECFARASGDPREQALIADTQLHVDSAFLDRDQFFDPAGQHVQRADACGRRNREDHVAC